MEFTDYYEILGVARDAPADKIRTAYRGLARKLHPDVNSDAAATERFKRVNEAYEVLKDPEKRGKYDRLGKDWDRVVEQPGFDGMFRRARRPGPAGDAAGAGASGFSDFFETFFRGGAPDLDELFDRSAKPGGRTTFRFRQAQQDPPTRRGADVEEVVDITLDEAMHGGVRLLHIGERQVEVRIPAGVAEASRVRVGGEGAEGTGGGARGDVYLRVHLRPHPRFTVRERDLLGDLPIRDDQAALGAEVQVETLSGSVRVNIPAGSQTGRTLRLRGKGIPGLRAQEGGDLLLSVRVNVPTLLTEEERQIYARLAELRPEAPAPNATAAPAEDVIP